MKNKLEQSLTSENETDIFKMCYKGGLNHPQAGKFMVSAFNLGANGEQTGGGWVRSFNKLRDAEKCVETIESINPAHEPKIDIYSPDEKSENLEPSLEHQELPKGEYLITVEFINRKQEKEKIDTDHPVILEGNENMSVLKKKVNGEIALFGLHNYGMDTYCERYPSGFQSVKITLRHNGSGKTIEYEQEFDGSGHTPDFMKN